MRAILFGLALILFDASSVAMCAEPQAYRAGVTRITVQDATPFDALVAYPTNVDETPFQAGPFTIAGSRDAPIASGRRFPIVLFSHGNGRSSGTSLPFRDLLTSLARRGFVVIAPFHPGTGSPLEDRPRQVRAALEVVSADQRFATHVDAARIAMIGFSFGGAVTLITAGAVPNLAHLSAYCRNNADDRRACGGVSVDSPPANAPFAKSANTLPLKAIVLMEPFGALFDQDGLKAVDMPVLLYRAERSDLKADGNILALAKSLPRQPRQESTAGGHFIFVDPCPPAVKVEAPAVCSDAADVDRAGVHQRIRSEIADFLLQHLR